MRLRGASMLGIMTVPSVFYTMMCFLIPESPRWLITVKSDKEKAKTIFKEINPDMSDAEIDDLIAAVEESCNDEEQGSFLFKKRRRLPIALAFLLRSSTNSQAST